MVKFLNDYVIEDDFPIEDLINKHKEYLIKTFEENFEKIKKNGDYNFLLPNNSFTYNILSKFDEIVYNNFYITPTYNNLYLHSKENNKEKIFYSRSKIFLYVQDNKFKSPIYHNHIHNSYLSSVSYSNIPKQGGEIGFIIGNQIIKIKPKPNKIYFFPSWLYHSPYPHKDNIKRICLNIDYESAIRISPKNKDIWW